MEYTGIEGQLRRELDIANADFMSKKMVDFVMLQEWSLWLSTPDQDPRWKNVWFIRNGRISYIQNGEVIPTPKEALTIDPGIDLWQTSEAQMREYFDGLLPAQQLQRLVELTNFTRSSRTTLKELPKEFADLKTLRLNIPQIKIMALCCYKKRWRNGIDTSVKEWYIGLRDIQQVPEWIRAALASKFVHRGEGWISKRLEDYVTEHDKGLDEKYKLYKGLDELKKTKPDWGLPQLIQLFHLGIPIKIRADAEYAQYISAIPGAQKNTYLSWLRQYEAYQNTPEKVIQRTINELRITKKLPDKKIEKSAWSVYDLKHNKSIVDINEKMPMRAASMIKPLVALAFIFSKEGIPLTQEEKQKIQFIIDYNQNNLSKNIQMTGKSKYQKANHTTSEMMQAIKVSTLHGGTAPQAVMDVLLKKLPPNIMNGISIVETIPDSGKTYKNTLTTWSVVEFYKYIYQNREQEPYKTLLTLLKTPKSDTIADKASIPKDIRVASKSGYTNLFRGDGGIIFALDKDKSSHPYIFVGMFNRNDTTPYWAGEGSVRSRILWDISGKIYRGIIPSK